MDYKSSVKGKFNLFLKFLPLPVINPD